MSTYDFIIVGAGSAGCVLANRLSAAEHRVLLLEAGGPDRHPLMSMPLAFFPLMRDPKVGWGYQTEPEPYAGGRVLAAVRGKTLGGSSSINGMMYARGHPADYDQWRQLGLPGWGYADVLPYFKRSETSWRGETLYHGGSGPLTVAPAHLVDEVIGPAIQATARARGLPLIDDFHGPFQEGFSSPEFTVHRGRRASTSARYLRPALARRNLTVQTRALVTRVLIERGRAVGVEYARGGQLVRATAGREVILSGGAFNSPQLLMLSGVGDADELRVAGVTPVHALPGVGKGLQDHPAIALSYAASGPIAFESQLRFDRLAWAALQWALTGAGPVAHMPVSAMAFIKTREGLDRPDFQLLFNPAGMDARVWFPGIRKGKGHVLAPVGTLLRPESRGWVRLRSNDPKDAPRIQLNLLAAAADVTGLRLTIRWIREFMAEQPAAGLVGAELFPGPAVQSDAEIDAHLRATCVTAFHPTSTCAMGAQEDAVVDAELKVCGLEGLRVVDASVMPLIPGGNTNAPTVMIAEKASDMILGKTLAPAPV